MSLLNEKRLRSLPGSVVRPAYSPNHHGAGIVHLGTGAFHRAHQAVYTDTALGNSGGDWRIVGSSLRSPAVSDQLTSQDNLYTVVSRDLENEEIRVIGSIDHVIYAPDDPCALIRAIANPQTRIVTLTITEKGYYYDLGKQTLDVANERVQSDLRNPDAPQTAPGFLVAGLRMRMQNDAGPLTVLSCDNLPSNGDVTSAAVSQMANTLDTRLADWIGKNTTFPSSMVDRIVPATTESDRQYAAEVLGVADQCPVLTEPFSQWVIEDKFAAGRPAWEYGGATFVSDVAPFEKMKLRLLNGSHSTMAYLGLAAGFKYIHEAISQSSIRKLVRTMMDREVTPTLDISNFNLESYKDSLVRRFDNASLPYETLQVAVDGSQKLPQRLLQPIRERLAKNQSIECLALAVAAWMRHVGTDSESGTATVIDDPLADELNAIRHASRGRPASLARDLLAIPSVFGDDLPADSRFTDLVAMKLTQLFEAGVSATISTTLQNLLTKD